MDAGEGRDFDGPSLQDEIDDGGSAVNCYLFGVNYPLFYSIWYTDQSSSQFLRERAAVRDEFDETGIRTVLTGSA